MPQGFLYGSGAHPARASRKIIEWVYMHRTWGSLFEMKPPTGLHSAFHVPSIRILSRVLVGHTSHIANPILRRFFARTLGRTDEGLGCMTFLETPWCRCLCDFVKLLTALPVRLLNHYFHYAVSTSITRRTVVLIGCHYFNHCLLFLNQISFPFLF